MRQEIRIVSGSGRRLSSVSTLDREITVLHSTARPYKEPVVVDKAEIVVVEGSARPLEDEKTGGGDEGKRLSHVCLGERENA